MCIRDSMKTAMTTASGRGYNMGRGIGGGGDSSSNSTTDSGSGKGEKTMVTLVTVFQLIPTLTALSLATHPVSYTHLRAHETPEHLVCRLLLEKKKKKAFDHKMTIHR
eukprot:TRINITY_DN39159_c0_g1_i2.p1 TRINITY_DN39159_c0_g1~~TRINITY_DN39159_c0_g1_i2.p1  ORF type:complete len:108 (-),score=30.51 TRINITY_DN39159_c0_g1_i2:29-352(-)